MTTTKKAMYTTREAAALLCCHVKTVRDYIAAKKLRGQRRGGGGDYLIHENDLRVFLGLEPDEALVPVSLEKSDAPKSQGNRPGGDTRPAEVDGPASRS